MSATGEAGRGGFAGLIRRMGEAVERGFGAADGEEEAFPEIAEAALLAFPPYEAFELSSFARAFVSEPRPIHRQLAPTGAFGQPGVTLYHGRGFVIDLYCWINCLSAIHNHPFSGLFTILSGYSVHCPYRFEEQERLGPRLSIGALRSEGPTLLGEGERYLFSRERHPLIHTLIHVPAPTVSMVIRSTRTRDYLRYFPPSFALAMSDVDDHIERQLAFLDLLRRLGDPSYREALAAFLEGATFEGAFRALSRAFEEASDPESFEALTELLPERHRARGALLYPALARAHKVQRDTALREGYREEEDRFFATALMCAERREEALSLIRARYGEGDPEARLLDWLPRSGLFEGEEDPTLWVARDLVRGRRLPEIRAALVEALGEETVREHDAAVASYCHTSLFASLHARI